MDRTDDEVPPPERPTTPLVGVPRSGPQVTLQDWTPRLAPRYRLERLLGQGGMGSVFLAVDTQLNRQVAIKVVNHTLGQTAKRLERFRREGEITAGLDHPNIVRVFSAGVVDELPYLAYEYVEGASTLRDVLPRRDRRGRVEALRDVARALGHAHRQGVVHRDVKPENVLCEPGGALQVADFGLALAQGLERITSTGAVLGTPTYLAPEQASGRIHQIGPPTDVWALGVMLYEALADVLPFQGTTLAELIVRVCRAEPAAPSTHDPSIPADLEAVTLRALAADPDARYPDGEALAADLDAWLAGEAVSATPPRGRRFASRRAFVGGALLAVAVGAVVWGVSERAQRQGPAVVPSPGPSSSAPAPDPARRRFERLRALPDAERAAAARGWLERFPEHPLAGQVRAWIPEVRPARRGQVAIPIGAWFARGGFAPGGQVLLVRPYGVGVLGTLHDEHGAEVRRLALPKLRDFQLVIHPRGFLLVAQRGPPKRRLAWSDWTGAMRWIEDAGIPARGRALVVSGQPVDDPAGPWRVAIGGHVEEDPQRGWVRLMRLRPDGTVEGARSLPTPATSIEALAFTSDGTRLLVGGDARSKIGGVLSLVRVRDLEPLVRYRSPASPARSFALAPDGRGFLLGTKGGQVFGYRLDAEGAVFELRGEQRNPETGLPTAHPSIVRWVAYAPDGKRLYSLSSSLKHDARRQLSVWRADRTLIRTVPHGVERASDVELSADGARLLVVGGDRAVVRWVGP